MEALSKKYARLQSWLVGQVRRIHPKLQSVSPDQLTELMDLAVSELLDRRKDQAAFDASAIHSALDSIKVLDPESCLANRVAELADRFRAQQATIEQLREAVKALEEAATDLAAEKTNAQRIIGTLLMQIDAMRPRAVTGYVLHS